MTVKERLIDFIKYKGLSQSRFESQVGLSNGYVNNIRKSISPEKLQSITLIFPELNTEWLLTGRGEKVKETQPQIPTPNYSIPSGVFIPQDTYDIIKQQAETICSQQRLIEELQSERKKMHVLQGGNAKCADVSGSDLEK
ncbi:helix-turn-helix transcriptional regulator [Bacteroides sp.]|uniref:helix-turn-helix domain-containing protein n=1 Tax=Bacteroides sp. TaxID=29523 RepID=UPI0025842175|nr:helix-turn-helix transcriptional regulator [Bacteroides sp.]